MALERHLKILDCGTEAGWMNTSLKVAFASSDMKQVDQHFGSAESFAVYAVDLEHTQLLEVAQFGQLAQDGNEDKLTAKMNALAGCVAVYSQAVGASAVGQLKSRGIQPVKVSAGASIEELLASLQQELRAGPAAWLARAIESQKPVDPTRFDQMESDGWDES
jgi:nitrogen fixation protein NifX